MGLLEALGTVDGLGFARLHAGDRRDGSARLGRAEGIIRESARRPIGVSGPARQLSAPGASDQWSGSIYADGGALAWWFSSGFAGPPLPSPRKPRSGPTSRIRPSRPTRPGRRS